MRIDHEELLLRNAMLSARAWWYLSREFADRGDGSAASLPHFILAGGILFHRASARRVSKMQFESGLLKAISDQPDLIAGVQERMEDNFDAVLAGLQVGTASGLLLREGSPEGPSFRAQATLLPKEIREIDGHAKEILAAARRLGRWFADDPLKTVISRLRVEF